MDRPGLRRRAHQRLRRDARARGGLHARAGLGRFGDFAQRIEELPDRVLLYTSDGERALELMHARGIRADSALVRRATLEDVFLRLTGRTLVE